MDALGRRFPNTSWSLVLSAGCDSPGSGDALSALCESYWYPVYGYVRHRGHSPQEAEDLTQGFFARLLEKNWLAGASRDRGRFRSFLLGAINHYLANEWDRDHAEKRGGAHPHLSLDFQAAEAKFHREPADHMTPDRIFERDWALALLDRVMAQLRDESSRQEHSELFEPLYPYLTGDSLRGSGAQVAREMGMTEGAVRVALHRLRQRYGELVREEILRTVTTQTEVDEEILHLLSALDSS